MIPDQDYYADKDGKLTDDPTQYARQIGVKGHFLDEKTARRYGITDTLVSTGEPNAVRRVTGRNASSVQITKAEETEDKPREPQEPADAAEPTKAEEAKPEATKPTAKEGEKKK